MAEEETGKGTIGKIKESLARLVLDEKDLIVWNENESLLREIPYEELAPKLENIIDRSWTMKKAFSGDEETSAHPDVLTAKEGDRFKKFVEKKKFGKALRYLQNHAGMIGQEKLNRVLKASEEEPDINL